MSWLENIFRKKDENNPSPEPVKNPPATSEEISAAEQRLGLKLPAQLLRSYRDSNGVNQSHARSREVLRLMPLAEAADLHGRICHTVLPVIARKYSMVCFWADDKANYAGIFCGGPLEGRIFFVDFDGHYQLDVSPLYRSLDSFQEQLNEAAERNRIIEYFEASEINEQALQAHASRFPWYRFLNASQRCSWGVLPVDYRSARGMYSENDRAAYRDCRKRLEKDDLESSSERDFIVCTIARLTPPDEVASLFPFLKEDHMWLPERIARIIGQRECPEAVSQLVTLALEGHYNCRAGAKRSLARMVLLTPEAHGAVKAEYSRRGGDYGEIRANLDALKTSPTLFYEW